MITAKQAHELSNSSKRLDNILEDIEACIENVAEDGGFEISYTLPRHLEPIVFKELIKLGYTVFPDLNIREESYLLGLKINWRFSNEDILGRT